MDLLTFIGKQITHENPDNSIYLLPGGISVLIRYYQDHPGEQGALLLQIMMGMVIWILYPRSGMQMVLTTTWISGAMNC